jgi:hypothetical protein
MHLFTGIFSSCPIRMQTRRSEVCLDLCSIPNVQCSVWYTLDALYFFTMQEIQLFHSNPLERMSQSCKNVRNWPQISFTQFHRRLLFTFPHQPRQTEQHPWETPTKKKLVHTSFTRKVIQNMKIYSKLCLNIRDLSFR